VSSRDIFVRTILYIYDGMDIMHLTFVPLNRDCFSPSIMDC